MVEDDVSLEATAMINMIGIDPLIDFLRDSVEIFDLLHMSEEEAQLFANTYSDGDLEQANKIKVVRTVYILSKMVHKHYRMLKKLHSRHSMFWEKLEKIAEQEELKSAP